MAYDISIMTYHHHLMGAVFKIDSFKWENIYSAHTKKKRVTLTHTKKIFNMQVLLNMFSLVINITGFYNFIKSTFK